MSVAMAVESPPVPLRTDGKGVLRVGNTRVRLDTVITAWKAGESPEQIVENFDVLDLADVYAVISYYLNYRPEVEKYLEQNRQEGERLRAENEKRFPQAGIRERLLARRAELLNEES
ncbi:MAG: DUF433 domain-containing protein [Ardenticatenaceae bacterium]